MDCICCNEPLNKSQFNDTQTLKSCPQCSTKNGSYHVFYSYPSAFTKSDKRSTQNHPDGPQSYCTTCRRNEEPNIKPTLCTDV